MYGQMLENTINPYEEEEEEEKQVMKDYSLD